MRSNKADREQKIPYLDWHSQTSGFLLIAFICLGLTNAILADALTEALQPDKTFYENYADKDFQRLEIQKENRHYYDLFGEHIVDGFFIYELSQEKRQISNDQYKDSIALSNNTIFESKELASTFKNLVITKDAIGSSKFSFLVGNQIYTKFTPLTINKQNMHTLRWDLWSSGLKMSTLITRTRPDWVGKDFGSGTDKPNTGYSSVSYPIQAKDNYDPVDGITVLEPNKDFRLTSDAVRDDFTSKSIYGDYDMLFAIHAENRLGNFLNYGLSYINHHHSDIQQGEQWYGGLPKQYFPSEIHFEVYDATPQIEDDAGARVTSFKMYVSKKTSEADGYSASEIYKPVGVDSVLAGLGNSSDNRTDGPSPLIYTFKPEFLTGRDAKNIEILRFVITVSGNYRIFVSTDKFTGPQYANNGTLEEMALVGRKNINPRTVPNEYKTRPYYGEFIAESDGVAQEKTITYDYVLNISSETFGANFTADLGKFDLKGEVAVNTKRYLLPGASGEISKRRKAASYLELVGDATDQINLAARVYYLSPDWTVGLDQYAVSPFFSKSLNAFQQAEYLDPIYPLSANWNPIDDNEDNDQFVESEARMYPADGGGKEDYWWNGALKVKQQKALHLTMPTGLEHIYDDWDGVISDRIDKNRNGLADFREDFLLFEQDPPIFELANDINANGIFDQEDDDLYPDIFFSTLSSYPEHQPMPVYIYTSNGFYSLGLEGLNGRVSYSPNKYLVAEVGGIYERAVAKDFGYEEAGLLDFEKYGSPTDPATNFNVFNTLRYKWINRARGFEFNLENEIRYLMDGIRNDGVITNPKTSTNPLSYAIQTDELRYRNALIDNLIFRLTYQPKNFLVQTKLRLGGESRLPLENSDSLYITKTLTYIDSLGERSYTYADVYETYHLNDATKINWIGKTKYDLVWRNNFESGWRQYFNFINRLTITPEFKITLDYNTPKFPWQQENNFSKDPRTLAGWNEIDQSSQLDFLDYRTQNQSEINVIPILRASYRLAEKTRLEVGHQLLSHHDLLIPEENYTKNTTLFQIRNSDTYKGQNVNLLLGMQFESYDYTVEGELGYNKYLNIGNPYDVNNYIVFARIYSGI